MPGAPVPSGPRVGWAPDFSGREVTARVVAVGPVRDGSVRLSLGDGRGGSCPVVRYRLAVPGEVVPGKLMGCPDALAVGDSVRVRVYGDLGDVVATGWAVPAPAGYGWPGVAVGFAGLMVAGLVGWPGLRRRGSLWPGRVARVSRWVPVHAVIGAGLVAGLYMSPWRGEPEFRWTPGGGAAVLAGGAVAAGLGVWLVRRSARTERVRGWLSRSVVAPAVTSLVVLSVLTHAVQVSAYPYQSLSAFSDGFLVREPVEAFGTVVMGVFNLSVVAVLARVAWFGPRVLRPVALAGLALWNGMFFDSVIQTDGLAGDLVGNALFAAFLFAIVWFIAVAVSIVGARVRARRADAAGPGAPAVGES